MKLLLTKSLKQHQAQLAVSAPWEQLQKQAQIHGVWPLAQHSADLVQEVGDCMQGWKRLYEQVQKLEGKGLTDGEEELRDLYLNTVSSTLQQQQQQQQQEELESVVNTRD